MGILKPDYRFNSILEISVPFLKEKGIEGLLLDVDNTLAHHFSQTPIEGLEKWLKEIAAAGIKTLILSNARSSRVEPFAEKIGVAYTPKAMKPLPFRAWSSCREMGVKSKNTAIIGDQLFTDMLCGSLSGITKILVTPMHEETGRLFKIKRGLERKILK